MASHCATHYAFSPSSTNYRHSISVIHCCKPKLSRPPSSLVLSSISDTRPSYNTLVFQAARLLGPPATFEASKLKVVYMGGETDNKYDVIIPRTYTLSHCDFTANLTLTVSNVLHHNQLKGWYNKDDVVAEWREAKGDMCLDVHCYVSGPNLLPDLAAEFRYHIFSKELPLVLQAVLHGDSVLFKEHQELMDALVRVYFHSSSRKYNRVECWGSLKNAAQGKRGDQIQPDGFLASKKEESCPPKAWGSPKSVFQALLAFLLFLFSASGGKT